MAAPTILSRLQQGLRARDWGMVAVELAIVILGVFIGIEASNWNQARRDRAEERRYYAQIVDDLRQDQAELRGALRRVARHDEAAEKTLAAIRTGVVPRSEPGRFAVRIHYAGYIYLPRPARRTYDELVSTGNLGLIRDPKAKAAVADYYQSYEEVQQWDGLLRSQQDRYWDLTAGVLPRSVLRAAIRERVPAVTEAEAQEILRRARARERLPDLLMGMAAHHERVKRYSEHLAERNQALIKLLEPMSR
jgi:hypothetical protein